MNILIYHPYIVLPLPCLDLIFSFLKWANVVLFFCVQGIEKVPVQQCIHKVDTQCYFSYITDYTPTTEEVCSENYSKRCFIELSKKSVQETSEKCYYPTERVCNPPSEGEVAVYYLELEE